MYAVLAGLICTTSSVDRDDSRYFFVPNVLKLFISLSRPVLQLVNKRLHCTSAWC